MQYGKSYSISLKIVIGSTIIGEDKTSILFTGYMTIDVKIYSILLKGGGIGDLKGIFLCIYFFIPDPHGNGTPILIP